MTPEDLKDIPDRALVRLTMEGWIERRGKQVRLACGNGTFGLVDSIGDEYLLLTVVTAVEVLPEPVVEPTGTHALVLDRDGHPWIRYEPPSPTHRSPGWRSSWVDGAGVYRWDRLVEAFGPITVMFEGVAE